MFKNRSFQVKLVKDKHIDPDEVEFNLVEPAEIAQIIADTTIKTVTIVGGVIAANRVLKTVCEIAVVAAKAKLK
jgi:hypothetical protein